MKQLILFAFLLTHTLVTKAQMQDSIKAHLDSALLLLQKNSLYTSKVDWPALQKKVYAKAATATTKNGTFPAISYAFQQLDDHHGFFAQYDDQYRNTDSSAMKRYSENLLNEWKKGWKIKTALIGQTAYLRMPGIVAYNQQQIQMYTNLLCDSVAKLAALQPQAWVLDLRMNTGGNIRPMLAALAPFFEDGIVSWYIDQQQQTSEPYAFKNGALYIPDEASLDIKKKTPAMHKVKLAVLIGAGTGSSGEICAAILQQRNNTALFGEPTAGLCNSTQGFVFNHEESYFLLTTQHLASKSKQQLPNTVTPNVVVENNDLFNDLTNDNAVKAALAWLKGEPM